MVMYHNPSCQNLFDKITSRLNKRGLVGGVFLDLCKAFSPISNDVLILEHFSPRVLVWMSPYLSIRVQYVKVFSLHINGLP